jgi:hypothetical protein
MKGHILTGILILTFLAGTVLAGHEDPDTASVENGELQAKVNKIFSKSCATSGCHGGKHPKMQLSLEADDIPDNMIGVPSKQNGDMLLIDTNDPSKSYLLLKMTGGKGMKGKKMPIMKAALKKDELEAVTEWIYGFEEPEEEPAEEEEDEEDGD